MTSRAPILGFLFVVVLLFLSASLQGASNLSWFGVRPDVPLAFLVALAFVMEDFFIYVGLVLIAGALVGPVPGFSIEELVFILVLVAVFFLRERLPIRSLFATASSAAGATLVFYLAVDASFLTADSVAVFFEMIYNALLAALFYGIVSRIPLYAR